MKNLFLLRHLFFCCLILTGIALPVITRAQIVTISGDINVCVGQVATYTPDTVNAALDYDWSVSPPGSGTILAGNSTGSNIQWNTPGAATVLLTIRNPLANNAIVFTGSRSVTIHALPSPFITTDLLLACQPLNEDSAKKGDQRPPQFDESHCQLVCSYSTVLYTANGNPGSTYTWSAPGSTAVSPIGSGATCNITWGAPGFGEVRVTETTAAGCETTTFFCVEITESPTAKFRPIPDNGKDPIILCRNGELVLIDESTGSTASPIVSWLWDWGDGHISTTSPGALNNPVTHVYDNPGDYTVTLTVTNSCGCVSKFSRKLKVIDPEAPKISCPRIVCEGERAVYTIDKPCDVSSWEVEGGTIINATPDLVEVVWDNVDPSTGFGYVMYKSCDPCPMVVTEAVPVLLKNAKIQGPQSICVNQQYVYRLPKWPATEFNWYVSGPAVIQPTDQRNEIALTATGVGSIVLGVKYRNTVLGCEGSSEMKILVKPQATISGDDLFCQGESRTYNLGGASGDWTLRNYSNVVVATGTGTSFGYTFTTPGVYRLSAIGSAFCPPEDFVITVVGIPAPPDVILGPDRACPGIPVRYDAGNPISGTTYQWSVPTGGSASAAVGDYSYITFATVPGTIQLRRVTLDEAQCVSSPISRVILDPVPPLSISGNTPVCHSTEEVYTLNYEDGDLYEWSVITPNLGSVVANGNSHQPTILWNVPNGVGQNATLRVKVTKCGMEYFSDIIVFVRGVPAITGITLAQDTVCSNTAVTIQVSTTYAVGAGTTGYSINWGDGFTTTGTGFPVAPYPYEFTHVYNTDGQNTAAVFTPAITINNPNGCLGSVTATAPVVTVMPRPIAVVSPTGPIAHCGTSWSETLIATVTTGIGGSNSYVWNVPVGATPPVNNPIYTGVDDYGGYSITVTNSVFGCSSTSNTVSIFEYCGGGTGPSCGPPPPVTLTTDTANCSGILINATVPPGYAYSWIPPVNSGISINSSSSTAVTATATVAGNYTFIYRIYYGSGCYKDTYINVLVPYLPDLRYQLSCNQSGSNYNVTLYDHSTQFPLTPITARNYYLFTPPSTVTALGTGMSVTTTQPGGTTRMYIQRITGVHGPCYDTISVTTPVFPTVNVTLAPLVPNPGCVVDVVYKFNYTTTGTITNRWWDFGDFSYNAAALNPMNKVYNTPGTRTPSLKVTDEYGCFATAGVFVDVRPNPYQGNTLAMPNPVCQGSPVTLSYNATAGGAPSGTYTWYKEEDPLYTTSFPTTSYQVYEPGGYWVRAVGNFGCVSNTALNIVAVNVIQVPPVSVIGNGKQCVGQAFTLSTQSYGAGYTYSWSGAGSGTGTSLTQTLYSAGTYTYYVTITDIATGCSRTSPAFTVTVSTPPPPPWLTYNILNCDPYTLQIDAFGAAGTYNWSNGMLGSSIVTSHGGPYQVTLTDLNGCTVSNSISTPNDPGEYLWVFPTGCFCRLKNNREPYVIGPIIPFSNWAWIRDGGVSASGGGYMPNYYISPGSVYNMVLDNGYCSVTSGDMYYESDTCNRIAGRSEISKKGITLESSGDVNKMQLAPNPAKSMTMVTFRFASGSGTRSIDLYDVVGRRMQTHTLTEEQGSLELSLENMASGMYQVVMRRDGIIVQQSKLSVTK